ELADRAEGVGPPPGLPAGVVVVVGSEVLVAGAGVGQQGVEDLQLGVAGGDAGLVLAAFADQAPVPGAFPGLGFAGGDGGLAEDGAEVPVAVLVPGAAGLLAGLIVQRGAPGPRGQVAAGGEPGHVHAGLGDHLPG